MRNLIVITFFLLLSCGSKNQEPTDEIDVEIDVETVVGKWKIKPRTDIAGSKLSTTCNIYSIVFSVSRTFYIEFEQRLQYGSFVLNNNSISLAVGGASYGEISNISIINNQINFSISLNNLCNGEINGSKDLTYTDDENCELSNDISIGNQTWMSKNLSVTRFNNGDLIPFEPNPDVWKTLTTPAYTYFDGNINNVSTYGLLYNWYALNDQRGIAPDGYRIPTRSDFIELTSHLGLEYLGDEAYTYTDGNTVAEQLKGISYWQTPNSNNNNSCFNALPGGFVASYDPPEPSGYGNLGHQGVFWTSTENPENREEAFYFILSYPAIGQNIGNQMIQNNIALDERPKTQGFSIRCIRQ